MPAVTEPREDHRQDHLYQIRLREAASDRNRVEITATADLAYLITGLITITQFRLVRCILQGVEHTDPTEWSNSHLSIRDKFMLTIGTYFNSAKIIQHLLDVSF